MSRLRTGVEHNLESREFWVFVDTENLGPLWISRPPTPLGMPEILSPSLADSVPRFLSRPCLEIIYQNKFHARVTPLASAIFPDRKHNFDLELQAIEFPLKSSTRDVMIAQSTLKPLEWLLEKKNIFPTKSKVNEVKWKWIQHLRKKRK